MNRFAPIFYLLVLAFAAFSSASAEQSASTGDTTTQTAHEKKLHTAIFAGGCFWCVESDFEKLDGVSEAVSGYTGGTVENPSYEQVSKETTGHIEAVKVFYDPEIVSYRALADYFFRHVDPLDDGGQFCDRGPSYTTAIFATPDQEQDAQAAKEAASKALGKMVVTPIRPAQTFWDAEERHQNYYKKNSLKYRYYRSSCGRDRRVKAIWRTAK